MKTSNASESDVYSSIDGSQLRFRSNHWALSNILPWQLPFGPGDGWFGISGLALMFPRTSWSTTAWGPGKNRDETKTEAMFLVANCLAKPAAGWLCVPMRWRHKATVMTMKVELGSGAVESWENEAYYPGLEWHLSGRGYFEKRWGRANMSHMLQRFVSGEVSYALGEVPEDRLVWSKKIEWSDMRSKSGTFRL